MDPPDYAILNPIAPDRVNLALVVPLAHGVAVERPAGRFHRRPRPAAAASGPTTGRRHAVSHPSARSGRSPIGVEPPQAGGVLLVGDAAGFYDPFTGEGVFTALRSAELAVTTIVAALRQRGRVGASACRLRAGPSRHLPRQGARDARAAVPDPSPAPGQSGLPRAGPAPRRCSTRCSACSATTCRRAPLSARCAADDLAAAYGAARPKTSSSGTAANPAGSVNSASGISRRSTRATAAPGAAPPPPWNTTFSGHPSE